MAKKLKIYNGSSWEDVTFAITPPNTAVTNVFNTNQVIDASTSVAALRITQRGSGEAFRVEDSTNPDSSPFVIDADGLVGIGTTDFTVRASTNIGSRIVTNGGFLIVNYGNDSSITVARANGTSLSPTQVLANERIAFFIGSSYGSSSFNNNVAINFHAAENQTDTARGSYITVETTALGTVGRVERMRIAADGTSTFSGQVQSTLANNTANGSGQIYLNGASGNRIDFNASGSGAPSLTTRSAGTKIVFYPGVSATDVDHGLGVEANANWYSVPTTSHIHKFYGGTTVAATLSGSGAFSATSTISASGLAGSLLSSTSGTALGAAAAGTAIIPARADHVHPTATTVVATVTGTNSADLVYGSMADNDQFRIRVGGTATNAGFVEIATADDGTEPIYVRQYTGVFASLARTATLLDGSGNTSFPGVLDVNGVFKTASGAVIYGQNSANISSNNGLTLGTIAKANTPSGGQGGILITSNDATNQLQGTIGLVTDATAGNRRLSIGAIEQNVAYRNVTLVEGGGNVGIGLASPSSKLTVGANPPTAGALAAVASSAGVSLALSDNINNSLYVRHSSGGAIIGTDPGGPLRLAAGGSTGTEVRMSIYGDGQTAFFPGVSLSGTNSPFRITPPSSAQGITSGITLYATFQNTGDNGARRAVDIVAGYNGGAWGSEYLTFNVGTGGGNDAGNITTERMRIAGDGATTVTYTNTTGKAVRNTYMSTSAPSGGADGDVWIQYV